jgi:hypothetical protein
VVGLFVVHVLLHVSELSHSLALGIVSRCAFKPVFALLCTFGVSRITSLPVASCFLSLGQLRDGLVLIRAS